MLPARAIDESEQDEDGELTVVGLDVGVVDFGNELELRARDAARSEQKVEKSRERKERERVALSAA
jgi:hypothetical protein